MSFVAIERPMRALVTKCIACMHNVTTRTGTGAIVTLCIGGEAAAAGGPSPSLPVSRATPRGPGRYNLLHGRQDRRARADPAGQSGDHQGADAREPDRGDRRVRVPDRGPPGPAPAAARQGDPAQRPGRGRVPRLYILRRAEVGPGARPAKERVAAGGARPDRA